MFKNKRKVEYINSDIDTLRNYYNKCSLLAKEQIREKWIFTELKKLTLESKCKYLQKAYTILQGEDIYKAQESLHYLNNISTLLTPKKRLQINIFKALLNELLLNYTDAAKEYKKCNFNKYAMQVYRDFINRTKDLKTKTEITVDIDTSLGCVESNDIETLKKSAKSLEDIAKYYARSSQSIDLARSYFKQALILYKKIFNLDLNYTKNYILALIKACETYKMSTTYLDEAQYLIFHSNRCKDTEFYLLNKIKILKEKS